MRYLNIQNKPNPATVFGPYTPWPRRPLKHLYATGAAVAAAAAFVHCVVPMLA